MNKQLDSNYYRAHGKCLDCTAEFETQLKLNGTWKEHTENVHNKEIDKLIEEYKAFMEDKLNESNDGFIPESGEVEKWVGGINKDRAGAALQEGIEYLESLKK